MHPTVASVSPTLVGWLVVAFCCLPGALYAAVSHLRGRRTLGTRARAHHGDRLGSSNAPGRPFEVPTDSADAEAQNRRVVYVADSDGIEDTPDGPSSRLG